MVTFQPNAVILISSAGGSLESITCLSYLVIERPGRGSNIEVSMARSLKDEYGVRKCIY